ncbi:adenylate/guanylate cyclase domain-containing protein [Neosynechococcus sphagnicola]|uniref:adenylate/guanylate cyclase domain-containing protein n=1 Tax=Neosynechococcus sphagnicola TaxID=1501145 RepID=UPI0012E08E98|nr:adenylate/guanylate cyclase domain-containing protein [Neosynechococcus sphagnicola]
MAIDEQSLTQGEFYTAEPQKYPYLQPLQSFPWERQAYAQAIDKIMGAGARSVSLDLIFSGPSNFGPGDDQSLQQVLDRYPGRVTMAAAYESSMTPEGPLLSLTRPIFQTQSVGFLNYLPSIDGRIHNLGSQYQSEVIFPQGLTDPIPSFPQATLQAARMVYPAPRGSGIFFYGPRDTFQHLPFFHVLDPQRWQLDLSHGQYFRDKIVLIGPTALSLQDNHRTPFAGNWRYPNLMPGVEIHANAIATLLEGRTLAAAIPAAPERGLLVLVGVAAVGGCLSLLGKRSVSRLFWGLGCGLAWGLAGYLSFTWGGWIVPTAVPVLAIALGSFTSFTIGAVSDQFEKLRLRRTLERYVATPIVREILSQPENFQSLLQGRKVKAAVLFCDIRGFTTLSYHMAAEQLVFQLNTYLNRMVEAIIESGGTLDKFIGDAVMAEFGSPVSRGETLDAHNAIAAALKMRHALIQLRQQWRAAGQIPFFHGIGISYGEVIAGNIGSLQRLEYTVIGDSVNVASRVEGLTKELSTDLLITEPLYLLVQDEIEALDMGEHPLRGRGTSIRLYSVLGWKGEDPSPYYQIQSDYRQTQGELKQRLATPVMTNSQPPANAENVDSPDLNSGTEPEGVLSDQSVKPPCPQGFHQ